MITEMLKERMTFLEDLGYDKYFYGCFASSRQPGVEYELYLRGDKLWVLRTKQLDVKLEDYPGMTSEQIIQNLGCLGIDEEEVYAAISYQCLNQINYADLVIDEATKLFGSDVIESTRKAQKDFYDTIISTIRKLTDDKKVIKGEGQTTPKRIGHLRVVKE